MASRDDMIDAIEDMSGTIWQRRVGRFESKLRHLLADTAKVTDSKWQYETAVSHTSYNPGIWAIIETYDTLDEAKAGHKKWINTMMAEDLPTELFDCYDESHILIKSRQELEDIRDRGFSTVLGPPIKLTAVQSGLPAGEGSYFYFSRG